MVWRADVEEKGFREANRACIEAGGGWRTYRGVIRKVEVTEQTYFRWKSKYAGLEAD